MLAGFATGSKPKLALPKRVLLLDYRFLELLGPVNALQIFDKAEPALLAMLAGDSQADARLQIAAAEAALRLNALSPEAVADVYRRQSLSRAGACRPGSAARPIRCCGARCSSGQPRWHGRRPSGRASLRAILDDARRSGYLPADGARAWRRCSQACSRRPILPGFSRDRGRDRAGGRRLRAGRGSGPRRLACGTGWR